MIDKLWHNSNGGSIQFEEALMNGTVKRMLDNEQYILNDDYQGNIYDILMDSTKSKKMFEMIIEHNFDLNAICNGRGTLLDELMRDSDRHFKEIDLVKRYGAKTLSELGVKVEIGKWHSSRISHWSFPQFLRLELPMTRSPFLNAHASSCVLTTFVRLPRSFGDPRLSLWAKLLPNWVTKRRVITSRISCFESLFLNVSTPMNGNSGLRLGVMLNFATRTFMMIL